MSAQIPTEANCQIKLSDKYFNAYPQIPIKIAAKNENHTFLKINDGSISNFHFNTIISKIIGKNLIRHAQRHNSLKPALAE